MADTITNKMKGRAIIIDQNISDLLGSITVSTKEELSGQIKVFGNRQKMKASYEVVSPPIYTKIINPIKDTYVRSDRDAFSYGTNSTLHTGSMGENINTQSFMRFDLHKGFTDTTILTNAKLRLYITDLDSAASQISLYKIDKDWQENNTTYLNKPNKTDLIVTKDIPSDITYIDIDISDYVKEAFKNPDSAGNYGFEFEVTNSSYSDKAVYSREANVDIQPTLTLKYYDINDLVDSSDLYGQITVTQKGISDINSQIKVRTINVTDSNYIEGSIKISKADQLGNIKILGKSDLEGQVKIESPGIYDLSGQIQVDKDKYSGVADLIGAQIVISKMDELGFINVATSRTSNSDLSGVIKVGRYVFGKFDNDAYINIHKIENNDLSGQIKVINSRTTHTDLVGGQVIISKMDELGTIPVISYKDEISDTNGKVLVHIKSELEGQIKITNSKAENKDQNATINIKRIENKDLNGQINVSIDKNMTNDIEGSIKIDRTEYDDQYGKILVSSIKILNTDLNGNINIKRIENKDQNAIINIKRRDGYDLIGNVSVTKYKFRGSTQIIYR